MCRRFAWQELPAVYSAWKRIAKERVRGNQKRDGICHRVFDFSFFAILRVQSSCRSAVHCSHALQRVASIKTLWFFLCPADDSSLHLPTGRAARQQMPGKSVLRQLRIAFACIAPLCWPFWSQHSSSTFFICLPFCSKRQAARNLQPQNGQGCIIEALP